MINISGNTQAFIIAWTVIIGFFVYILTTSIRGTGTDPVVLPVLSGLIGTISSFFFSSHLANGAAAKALDVMLAARGLPTSPFEPQPPVGDKPPIVEFKPPAV